MTFFSYAQNFEDVILWRALGDISEGFYIDIGAWSPDIDSVTRAFYECGWAGVNVEPNPEFHHQLEKRRPRDINLQLAISDEEGILEMNFLGNPGLSTLDDNIAQKHLQEGWSLDRQKVQVITLSSLWKEHIPLNQEVHFLKVDVEGFEAAALKSNNWTCNRPWIVVVEATLPMSQIESHAEWEPILLNANYLFAYADGLNRFYVAREHETLLPAFKYPPNVFDSFKLSSQQLAEEKAQQAEVKAQQAETKAQQAETKAQQAETKAQQAETVSNQALTQLHAVYASTSWRITAPLRWISFQFRLLRQHGPIRRIKAAGKKVLRRLMAFVSSKPRLKRFAAVCAQRLGVANRLRQIYWGARSSTGYPHPQQVIPRELSDLTPRAREIYQQLKQAIQDKKGQN